MEKVVSSKILVLLFTIFICGFAGVFLYQVITQKGSSISYDTHASVEITDGWQYRPGDSPKDGQGIPLWLSDPMDSPQWKGFDYLRLSYADIGSKYVWIRATLPQGSFNCPSLFLKSEDQVLEVYLDRQRIYSFGEFGPAGKEKAPGSPWHMIPLPSGFQGKTVFFRMHSILSHSVGSILKVELDSVDNHMLRIIREDVGSLALGFLCVMMGIFLVFAFLVQKGREREYYFLGFFVVFIGIWVVSETDIKQLLLAAPRFWQYLAFLSSYLMPVAFCLFIKHIFAEENTSAVKWLLKAHIIYAAGAFVLDFLNLLPIIFTLRPFLILLIFTMIASLVTAIRAALKGKMKAKIFISGFAFLCLFAVYDILGWHFKMIPWRNHITQWGMFIFIISLIYMTVRQFTEVKETLDEIIEHDRIKTEYFVNVSHELRTPLNIILGTLQLLNLYRNQGASKIQEANLGKHIKTMKQNCLRLIRLVNNLIDITKTDSGYIKLYPQNCNIVSLVEDITMSTADYIKSKGIAVVFDTDVEEKIIACDPNKIERIILNLLSNAVKFTDPGGEIRVRVKDENKKIAITVSDTGIGIPQDKLALIFERYGQVEGSLMRNHEGSGIGLSLVCSFVEAHGGTIVVQSEEGKGSSFTVVLPVESLQETDMNGEKFYNSSEHSYIERIDVEFSDIYLNEEKYE